MSANSDNPAGMSTRWLRQRVNELSASLADMTQTVWELSQTVSQLSENLESTSALAADNADRIHALELSVWRYHERPALVARLVAIGYDETEAAETVDMLVATSIDIAEQGVALREQLATLRYTPTEIEECIEDVPNLKQADIDYAKGILDAWDPATTSLADAYKNNTQLVIFPKIDTSNVTNMNAMFHGCSKLQYIPLIDTSRVTTATWMFSSDSGHCAIRRLPAFKFPSLKSCYGPYSGLRNLEIVPEVIDLSETTGLYLTFWCSRIPINIKIKFNESSPIRLVRPFIECTLTGQLPITEFPENATEVSGAYAQIKAPKLNPDQSDVIIRARGATTGPGRMFESLDITHAPQFDMPGADSLSALFRWCDYLTHVPDYADMAPVDTSEMFCSNSYNHPLARVEGLNFARISNAAIFGTDNSTSRRKPNLRYMRIVNLGQSELTAYDFSLATVWGTGSEEARQSLVNSLLTDSYDRAAAAMAPATVRLSTASKAALTAEEIAAITAKGFTIA